MRVVLVILMSLAFAGRARADDIPPCANCGCDGKQEGDLCRGNAALFNDDRDNCGRCGPAEEVDDAGVPVEGSIRCITDHKCVIAEAGCNSTGGLVSGVAVALGAGLLVLARRRK
jgi:uncharacterized protein (TIGR03382 family)